MFSDYENEFRFIPTKKERERKKERKREREREGGGEEEDRSLLALQSLRG